MFAVVPEIRVLFSASSVVRILVAALLMWWGGHGERCCQASSSSPVEIQRLYEEARESFNQANEAAVHDPEKAKELYRASVLMLERLAREGNIENGKLFYNIGNIYFRLGDLGRSILYYRRARQWIPHDPNLQQNLAYARSRRVDRMEEEVQAKIFKTLFFWHYDLGRFMRTVLLACFFNAFWIFAGLLLFKKKPWLRYGAASTALLTLLMASSLAVEAFQESRIREGVVLAPEVTARKGDGPAYQPAFEAPIHAGTEFRLLEERQGWYRIRLMDGRQCWIPASAAETIRSS